MTRGQEPFFGKLRHAVTHSGNITNNDAACGQETWSNGGWSSLSILAGPMLLITQAMKKQIRCVLHLVWIRIIIKTEYTPTFFIHLVSNL